jgi:hypothetical protein
MSKTLRGEQYGAHCHGYKSLSVIALALVFLLTGAGVRAETNSLSPTGPELPFKTFAWGRAEHFCENDRVCFLGNSITKGGLCNSYIELFYATRCPGNAPTFFNAGVGGDRA